MGEFAQAFHILTFQRFGQPLPLQGNRAEQARTNAAGDLSHRHGVLVPRRLIGTPAAQPADGTPQLTLVQRFDQAIVHFDRWMFDRENIGGQCDDRYQADLGTERAQTASVSAPSMPGRCRSMMTMSKRRTRASATAASPSRACDRHTATFQHPREQIEIEVIVFGDQHIQAGELGTGFASVSTIPGASSPNRARSSSCTMALRIGFTTIRIPSSRSERLSSSV